MGRALIIGGISVVAAGAIYVSGKYAVEKLKRAAANIDLAISFNRVHGLVGDGLARFLNPTIRVYVDLTLKNYSGFDLEATNIFTRIESRKPGASSWSIVATQQGYMNIKVLNGKEQVESLPVDMKGFSTIASVIDSKVMHRAVVKYTFKGIEQEFVQEMDISGPVKKYWDQVKSKFPSLRGLPQHSSHSKIILAA